MLDKYTTLRDKKWSEYLANSAVEYEFHHSRLLVLGKSITDLSLLVHR